MVCDKTHHHALGSLDWDFALDGYRLLFFKP